MIGISMAKRYVEKNYRDYVSSRYRKQKKGNKVSSAFPINENEDPTINALRERIFHLEEKIEFMLQLFDSQNKSFNEFLSMLRQAQLQDVRAKEKAYDMIANNKLHFWASNVYG